MRFNKTAVYRKININQIHFSLSVSVHRSFLFACTLFFFGPSLSYSQNSPGIYLVSTSLYRAVCTEPLLLLLGSLVRKGKIFVDSLPNLKIVPRRKESLTWSTIINLNLSDTDWDESGSRVISTRLVKILLRPSFTFLNPLTTLNVVLLMIIFIPKVLDIFFILWNLISILIVLLNFLNKPCTPSRCVSCTHFFPTVTIHVPSHLFITFFAFFEPIFSHWSHLV